MVDYPIKFESTCEAEEGTNEWNLSTDEGLNIGMSVPEAFGGSGDVPSPESLYSASLQSCMVATFKTMAERKDLDHSRIVSKCTVSLDRGGDSRPVMKEAEIDLKIEGVEKPEKAEEVSEMAEKNCFIHNSVNTDVRTNFRFEN